MARGASRVARAAVAAAACGALVWQRSETWLGAGTLRSKQRVPLRCPRALVAEKSDLKVGCAEKSEAYIRCVEQYDPRADHEPFQAGADGEPSTGFRTLEESILPFNKNPEWMIWPEKGFERDQKVTSMYSSSNGLYTDINNALRTNDEDGLRRLAPMIWEMRQLLRFDIDKIGKPGGRHCKPYRGKLHRGLDFDDDKVKAIADSYKIGDEFYWPAFTACNTEEEGLWPYEGNLNFEITQDIDVSKLDAKQVYAPVLTQRFIQDVKDVLFPPRTKFRVVGEKPVETIRLDQDTDDTRDIYTKILEVVELPTV